MCDLLVASFATEYRAPKTLHRFMVRSIERGDVDGWGVGFFLRNRRAVIIKDAEIRDHANTSKIFDFVARSIESEIILVHFRLATRKELYGSKYAHPFLDSFLGEDWIFAHNGDSEDITHYRTKGRILHDDPRFDSPRVFEYIRDKMIEYIEQNPSVGLYNAVYEAVKKLYFEFPSGTYNFVLANSNVIFFNLDGKHPHNNKLYLLIKRRTRQEKAVIATTVPELTRDNWMEIKPSREHRGVLLMLSEGEILFRGQL